MLILNSVNIKTMYLVKRTSFLWLHNKSATIGTDVVRRYMSQSSFILEPLVNRTLIRLHGNETSKFLQDLTTNDMNHFTEHGSSSIYSMFLMKNGRILYDTIIYKTKMENSFLIECDKDGAKDLCKHLQMFRIRKKIDINIVNDLSLWVAFNPVAATNEIKSHKDSINEFILPSIDDTNLIKDHNETVLSCHDPRLKNLGTRIIAPQTNDIKSMFPTQTFSNGTNDGKLYQRHRYQLGIAEGIRELETGKSFPLESNCEYLHGISFHKGCYLGQEFTARTHYTGVIRKRLMPIELLGELPIDCSRNIESTHGDILGKLKGFDNGWGIGLLKVEQTLKQESPFVVGNKTTFVGGKTKKPFWWSVEAPSLQELKEKTNLN